MAGPLLDRQLRPHSGAPDPTSGAGVGRAPLQEERAPHPQGHELPHRDVQRHTRGG